MAQFKVTKLGNRDPVGTLTYGSAAAKWTPMGAASATVAAVAASGNFIGFLDKAILSAANYKTYHETLELHGSIDGDKGELPYVVDDYISLVEVDEAEVSGAAYVVVESTGAITDQTAIGTQLAFYGGKFRVVQSGETAFYTLIGQLGADGSDNLIRVRRN